MAVPTFLAKAIDEGTDSSPTVNLAVTGDDRALVAGGYNGGNPPKTATASWAAGPTSMVEDADAAFGTFFRRQSYHLEDPTSGTDDVEVTLSGSGDHVYGAMSFNDAHATQDGDFQASGVTNDPASVTKTMTGGSDNDLIVDIIIVGTGVTVATNQTNQTERHNAATTALGNDVLMAMSTRPWSEGADIGWDITGGGSGDPVAHMAWVIVGTDDAVTGTITPTLENAIAAAVGAVEVTGTSAQTLADYVGAVVGAYGPSGTIGVTLADYAGAAEGSVGVPIDGSIAVTLDPFVSAAQAVYADQGTITVTLEDYTGAVVGAVEVTGTIGNTLDNFIAQAAGESSDFVGGFPYEGFNRGGRLGHRRRSNRGR